MYERLTKCPLCKSGHFLNYLIAKDHAISGESFNISICKNCTILFTNPRPDKANIGKYYDSTEYVSHANKTNNLINLLYKAVRIYTTRQKLRWINSVNKSKGRILDFGCGTGHLLKILQDDGWQTTAFEPNPIAAKQAENLLQQQSLSNISVLKSEKKFDVITLFHVLEHIHDLHKTFKILLDRLKKRGTLYVAVPNINSHDFIHYKENWAALDVPRHLYHFTSNSMEYLAERYDLKIIEKKPLYFDAFYVSMLSEKYLGSKNPLTSLLKGYRFNKQAAKSTNGHSSILYILKKK
ncbi:SAM-dependent methyltransferase [Lunatimonas lonarensis]|uniref:SAM-dependent methyltransferase n=1 Tax=Lunatimonas lonarensis TaxID=1232681 RepID=R7ZNN0_9BACT|nr:class I SAM-dependent methyltransferase [Lunatimonas lonarensis]EON75726.1 SAM-dependent methyltransferase [Lunatimonas lonarensis]